MQEDFHYYGTYCAAYLSGYTHEESELIAYADRLVDLCSATFLHKLKAPVSAATTQLQLEMMDARTDAIGLHDITRIWASFHFLPRDLYATKPRRTRRYMQKYRLMCGPNGDLVKKTVELAKDKGVEHIGIAMHVLADTWAHMYYAGTPSLVINNTDDSFFELVTEDNMEVSKQINFSHNPTKADDIDRRIFVNSIYQSSENAIMNLGHGRAGHLPDYSYIKYKYMPAWADYKEIVKDNPSDYTKAFTQMVYAMKYLRGETEEFALETYDDTVLSKYGDRIKAILTKRQLMASDDWQAFGEELSGQKIADFDIDRYQKEYTDASGDEKSDTYIGRFTDAAIAHKGMVTDNIYKSGNRLAGLTKRISIKDIIKG